MTLYKIQNNKKKPWKFEVIWYGRLERGENIGIFNTEQQAAHFAEVYTKHALSKLYSK